MEEEADVLSLCAIDPGGTTGWSILHVPARVIVDRQDIDYSRHECGHFTGPENSQAEEIVGLFEHLPWMIVIMEDFTLRQLEVELSPVTIAAKVEYIMWSEGMENPYIKQMPSEAKSTATDARLRSWGLWEVGKEHARDANRHNATLARKLQNDRGLLLKLAPWVG